jgi:hypothetical protein
MQFAPIPVETERAATIVRCDFVSFLPFVVHLVSVA